MKTQLMSLLNILSDEVELHESLLGTLEEETKSIGNVPASKLLQIQSAKQIATHKIASIEKRRIEVVQTLAEQWNVDFRDLTLSKIIARTSLDAVGQGGLPHPDIPSDVSDSLQERYERLKQIVVSIRKQARHNSSIAETRLKPIEMSLKFIHDWHKEQQNAQQTYSMSGELQNSSNKLSRASI